MNPAEWHRHSFLNRLQFVILDTATTEAAQIAALAVALLALGGVYWLLLRAR